MVQMKQVARTCDRCYEAAPATTQRIFAIEDRHYLLDLCDKHGQMFDREMSNWFMVAADVENPYTAEKKTKSDYFIAENERMTKSILDAAAAVRDEASVTLFGKMRAEQVAREEEENAYKAIPGAGKWRFSNHARKRMAERGYSVADVLQICSFPRAQDPVPWRGPSQVIYYGQGTDRVIVNDETHVIITVVDKATNDLTPEEYEAKRQHNYQLRRAHA